jgi:hypothetical protein
MIVEEDMDISTTCEVCSATPIQRLITKKQKCLWDESKTIKYIVGRCEAHFVKTVDVPSSVYEKIL